MNPFASTGWNLQVLNDEVVLYDASGDTLRFKKAADGTFTTPKGYSRS